MKGQFKGPWADYIKSASVSNGGITATLSNPVSNWANSTMDVTFRVDANTDWDYSPTRSVQIFVAPPLQPSYTKSAKLGLEIIPPPALTGSSVPRADYYQTVDVTLTGTNLNGASLPPPRRGWMLRILSPGTPVKACNYRTVRNSRGTRRDTDQDAGRRTPVAAAEADRGVGRHQADRDQRRRLYAVWRRPWRGSSAGPVAPRDHGRSDSANNCACAKGRGSERQGRPRCRIHDYARQAGWQTHGCAVRVVENGTVGCLQRGRRRHQIRFEYIQPTRFRHR